MNTVAIISVKKDGTIQLPRTLRERANIAGKVKAIAHASGILLTPADGPRISVGWSAVFASKLQMGRNAILDLSEVSLDGLWL